MSARRRAADVLRTLARRDLESAGRIADRSRVDDVAGDLGPALIAEQLHLVYQPIVDLRSRTCDRVEAFIRWRHPRLGLIDPRDIVRLARAGGLLSDLAAFALRVASRERERWGREGGELALSLNLAGDELAGSGAVSLRAAIAAADLDPRVLTFEIPAEGAPVRDLWEGARRIAALGARISIDDVSRADALSRTLANEIDELKISRAILRRAVADNEAALAVRGLIEAGRDFGLTVVAVGVEDTVTAEWLARAGCRLAQGYAVSLPLAATDVSPWRRWATRVTFGSISLAALGAMPAAVFTPHAVEQTTSALGAASTCCSLHAPGSVHDTGFAMRQVVVNGMHIYVEASMGDDVVSRTSAALARDVPAVQTDLGASFERAPDVYVFASRGSFALGLQNAFGQRATDAAALAAANGGVAFPAQSAIAINWASASADGDLSVVRHELAHVLAHQIAGPDADMPAWFDEGLATREQHNVAIDPVREAHDESATLALLRSGSVSLRDLASTADWTMANARLGGRGYAVAAQAVAIIDRDLGADGVHALLTRAHVVGFAMAFAEATGASPDDFSNAFPARAALLHDGPWIAQTMGDGQLVWSAAGFTADAPLHVTVDGSGYHLEFDARADHDGVYSAVFGGTVAPGSYGVQVTSGTMRAETRLTV